MADHAGDTDGDLRLAVERLAEVHAVLRFEPGGVLRLAAQHPHDADERVVVRIPSADADWAGALCTGAELLRNDLGAVTARRALRVVR